jgi:hypothetical protein
MMSNAHKAATLPLRTIDAMIKKGGCVIQSLDTIQNISKAHKRGNMISVGIF